MISDNQVINNKVLAAEYENQKKEVKMKKISSTLLMFLLSMPLLWPQEIIKSTFDTDDDGWHVEGGAMYYHDQGGNPDGFIEFEDNQDGAGVFVAPGKFLGDLTGYKKGTIKFDLVNTHNNGQDSLYNYGNVTITSSFNSASKNVVPLHYITDWTTYSIPLTAEEWGLPQSAWDSLMADVTELKLQADAQWNYYDRVGMDNFSIIPFNNGLENELASKSNLFLLPNFPNPFQTSTTIGWNLEKRANITLKVRDYLGHEIGILVNEIQLPGYHEVVFLAETLPAGVYFCQIYVNGFCEVKKMILLKE
jgi:hypothetical protein